MEGDLTHSSQVQSRTTNLVLIPICARVRICEWNVVIVIPSIDRTERATHGGQFGHRVVA